MFFGQVRLLAALRVLVVLLPEPLPKFYDRVVPFVKGCVESVGREHTVLWLGHQCGVGAGWG
jgi:hypothetical protein